MGARKQFTPEFKREAVQLLESGSRPASELAVSWESGTINCISGSGSSEPEARERVPARGRGRSAPRRSPV